MNKKHTKRGANGRYTGKQLAGDAVSGQLVEGHDNTMLHCDPDGDEVHPMRPDYSAAPPISAKLCDGTYCGRRP